MSTPLRAAAIAAAAAISVLLLVLAYLKLRRHLAAADHDPPPPLGLDPAVLRSLPVSVHASEEAPVECAVCITEIADGEEVRALPACGHRFHLGCVDMWFHSHPTCPLCRLPVGPPGEGGGPRVISGDGYSTEFPNLPTNVLFWGNLDRVSTGCGSPSGAPPGGPLAACGGEGAVRIDVQGVKGQGSRRWRRG